MTAATIAHSDLTLARHMQTSKEGGSEKATTPLSSSDGFPLRNIKKLRRATPLPRDRGGLLRLLGVQACSPLKNARRTSAILAAAALYIFIGADAETSRLPFAIERDERGYILTGGDAARKGHWTLQRDPYLLETSVPGIFACGDVRCRSIKRVAAAVGEGSMAIAFVHQFLQAASAP
jgi:hypothetical protein